MSNLDRKTIASDIVEAVSEESSEEIKQLAATLGGLVLEADKNVGKYLMLATKAKELMIRKSVAIENGTYDDAIAADMKAAVAAKFLMTLATEIGRAVNLGIDELVTIQRVASQFAVELSELVTAVKKFNREAVL